MPALAAEAPRSALDEARDALRRWQLSRAEELLAKATRAAGDDAVTRAILLGRLDYQRSRFPLVVERLDPVVKAHPRAYEARVVLGRALGALGEKQRAFTVLDPMADDWNADVLKEPHDLVWLAVGLQLTDYYKNANRIFGDALAGDSNLQRARILWAELFEEKYNFRDADQLYAEVLAASPDDPEALVGMARIDIESDRNYIQARERLEKVLAASPEHVPAHDLLARIALDSERPAEAIERLREHSLKIAPKDPEALVLLGAAHFVADDDAGFAAAEKAALTLNPHFAAFYSGVAEHAARIHRYAEANALNEKALALDPKHARAWANLGMGTSRMGDDDKAREQLERAYRLDPYDVRTYNLLDAFYDAVIKQYEWIEVPPLRVRVHKSERAILERYVPALLKEAWTTLVAKYGFTPEKPLHVEIFPDPQLFSVRSIGLPRLGAHGICFGHVITARSPSAGDFNWAEVLWHELIHVFHIQLSKSRVPRWFTEGLAVYESVEGRPAWRREMDAKLLQYREAGRLRGIEDFNLSFTRAKSSSDILVAYYHASLVAEFITKELGFPKLRAMLVAWGERKPSREVFAEAAGVTDLAAFDARFFAWLDARLAPLKAGLALDPSRRADDAERWIEEAAAKPDDAEAVGYGAQAALATGDFPKATTLADAALALDADQPEALFVRATLRLRAKEMDGSGADLAHLVALGHDGPKIREMSATIARKAGDLAAAAAHLEKAIHLDPQAGHLYYGLIELLDELGREADAFAWRKKAALLDQSNPALIIQLLAGAEANGATEEEVLAWGEQGNHIAPFSAAQHVAFAKELARLGKEDEARFEAESALIIEPTNAEAKATIGE